MTTATVTLRYSQALLQAADRLGLPATELALDRERIPLSTQDALWQHLCAHSEDPLIGIRLGLSLQVGHLDIAGLLLMSCETCGEALEALIDYLPIIGEGGDATLMQEADAVHLRYRPQYATCRAQRAEAVLAGIVHLGRWSTGGHFGIRALHLAHPALDDPQRYPGLLGCPVQFECADYRLCLEPQTLRSPLIQANAPLRDQLRALADQHLANLGEYSLSVQVSQAIRQAPCASREEIAAQLALSARHMNRRLAEDGVSFRSLREHELRRLAENALSRGSKILAIAQDLGFSDESAFAKAFRRWTGLSPAQFRDRSSS